jgi:SRSO17 transposase
LAEAAGDATPDGVQDFLSRMRWDADAVRDDLRAYVVEHLGDPDAVLVLDETGFLKKDGKSAGVQRQYSGAAGRVEDCQVGVFLGYASRHGRALIDRALYLPGRWTRDPARCAAAGIPPGLTLVTKPRPGLAMLDRALEAGVPFARVAGDSVYGADHRIRRRLEARGRGCVLAVTSGQRLGLVPVEDWLAGVPPGGWRRLGAGDGAEGPRLYDRAYLPYRGAAAGWRTGLLIRRSIADPDDLAYYLARAPEATAPARLVRVAGTRRAI